jgi:hypothetical protein
MTAVVGNREVDLRLIVGSLTVQAIEALPVRDIDAVKRRTELMSILVLADVESITTAALDGTVTIVTDVLADLTKFSSCTLREILVEVFADLLVAVAVRKGVISVVLIERAQDERKIG